MTTTPEATWRLAAVDSLRHHPRNLATHDERNHEVVRSSLEDWGQVQNLVVQAGTGVVIAGNCRLDELRELGTAEVMVCEVACDDDEADRLAAVLNRSEELRGWEPGALAATLKGWREGGTDIARLGWDAKDFSAVLARFRASNKTPPPARPRTGA